MRTILLPAMPRTREAPWSTPWSAGVPGRVPSHGRSATVSCYYKLRLAGTNVDPSHRVGPGCGRDPAHAARAAKAFAAHFANNATEIRGRPSATTSARFPTPRASCAPTGHRDHRPGHIPRRREGQAPGRPAGQPFPEIPASAAAHPTDGHQGPDCGGPGLADAVLTRPINDRTHHARRLSWRQQPP